MTVVVDSAEMVRAPISSRRRGGTVLMLQIQIWLLFLIPAGLRFAPLGAVGNPAIIFGVVLFLVWAVAVLAPSIDESSPCRPIRLVLSLLWASTLLSYAVMNRHAVVADELSNSDRYLISLLSFSGVALVAAEGLRDKTDLMRVVRTSIAAVATMAVIALLQSRAGFDATRYVDRIPLFSTYHPLRSVFGRSGLARPAGTATHPIEFGVVVGLCLALSIHVVLYDRVWPRWRSRFALGVIALGIPISISRSALLVGVTVLVVFIAGTKGALRIRTATIFAVFIVFVFVSVPGLLGTLRNYVFLGQNDLSISTRTSDYAAVAHYLRQSPWLGSGPGTFLPRLRILDNQYLLTLIESGLVGLFVLLALFSATALLGRSGRDWHSSVEDRNLGQMFFGCGLGTIFAAVTFDAFSFPMFTMFSALLAGLAGTYWRLGRQEWTRCQIVR